MATATSTTIHTMHNDVDIIQNISYVGTDDGQAVTDSGMELQRQSERKYSHAVAVHSKSRISCLSAGAENPPSLVGFRNLMIIMLSAFVEYFHVGSADVRTSSCVQPSTCN